MAAATNARHAGKRPAANEHGDQPAAAANKPVLGVKIFHIQVYKY
jgi:hypothetical protein